MSALDPSYNPAGSGPTGAAATISVGTVATGASGSSATVVNGGSSSAAVLNFSIPQGPAGPAVARVFSQPTRTIQTVAASANGIQISATRDADARYSVTTSTTSTIAGASTVTVVLETCATNSATAVSWTTVGTIQNSQTLSLAVALQVVQTLTQEISAIVPAGYYSRLRSTTTGTGSATFASGQEVLL